MNVDRKNNARMDTVRIKGAGKSDMGTPTKEDIGTGRGLAGSATHLP